MSAADQENRKVTYRIRCRSCKIAYVSDIPAIVGQPCPNPSCPHGNPPIARVWWEHPVVRIAATAGGLAVGTALYFNWGGWGTFALEFAISLLIQAVIALVLFGALLAVFLIGLKEIFKPLLSNRYILVAVFLIAAVMALPLLLFILHRPLDIYDVVQTIVLSIAANLLTKPFEERLSR